MAILRHRSSETAVDPADRRHGVGPWLRRWTIPLIGALTPVGLIVVNIAAFIVKHISEFRWTIAVLAFVSAIMLNSWAGLSIYRVLKARRPEHTLVHDRNQEVVLVGGMAVIIGIAFLTALFCYIGLSNANDLPNGATFVVGILAILVPIVLRTAFRSALRQQRGARPYASNVSGLQPTQPPQPPTR